MDEGKVYRAALTLWGADAQTLMAFEEMAELQKELCKHARGKDNRDAIAEEIADVEIMLEQMKILHGCVGLSAGYREKKLERLAERCGFDVEPQDGQHMKFQGGRVLGPGVSFQLENASASGPCATWAEKKTDTLLALKELSRWFNSRANSGDYRQKRYVEVLEFAISILSELKEIKEVRISAEPNTPGAWELMRDILAGTRPAPEGTVFDVVIDLTGNPQAIRHREEPEPAPRMLAIAMPGGETVKLNSAAEAYNLAGCIEKMAARVWPEAAPGK